MNIPDFFHRTTLTFVKKELQKDDIYSFYFSPKKPLHHRAGQHGLFTIPGIPTFRIFSLASAPEEPYVMISTHVRAESNFKQGLAALKEGDAIHMLGPVLEFTLQADRKKVVFLGQGIGITPFRSMLLHTPKNDTRITLIHVDRADHTFRKETEVAADEAYYPTTPEEFTTAITSVVEKQKDALYYLSGSPGFNKGTTQTLLSLGIPSHSIKKDNFLGY